jgi:hypothetical protein
LANHAVSHIHVHNYTRDDGDYPFENNYAWSADYTSDFKMLSAGEQTEFCLSFTKYSLVYSLTPTNHSFFNFFHFHAYTNPTHHPFLSALWAWGNTHPSHFSLYPTIVSYCHNHTEHQWNLHWNRRKTQISPLLYATMESLDSQWQGNTGQALNITCDAVVLKNGTVVSCGQFVQVYQASCKGFDFKIPLTVGGINIMDVLTVLALKTNTTFNSTTVV